MFYPRFATSFASVVHSSCNVLLGFASTQSCYYSWFALRHSAFVILCLVVSSQYIVSPPRISPPPFIQPFGLLRNYIVIPRLCRCVPKDPSETDFDSIPLWCTRSASQTLKRKDERILCVRQRYWIWCLSIPIPQVKLVSSKVHNNNDTRYTCVTGAQQQCIDGLTCDRLNVSYSANF